MPSQHTIPNRACEECGATFFANATQIARGGGKYCSRACYAKHRPNNRVACPCPVCGTVTMRFPGATKNRQNTYCSLKCRGLARRVGRVIDVYGYVLDWMPDGTRRLEHRWVMEQVLGRPLRPDEDVHHEDEDKTNNAASNLRVLTHAEHAALHGSQRPALDRWSLDHDCCVACGGVDQPHYGGGHCKRCYMRAYKPAYRAKRREQGLPVV